ncbi:MAG: sensor histidine kinase [Chloroflexota bacterium]
MIRSARVKLTLAYTGGIALIMAAFSMALYVALESVAISSLDVGGNATARVEQALLAADLSRARLVLLSVNAAGWILSACLSHIVARRTLRPIQKAVERQRQFTAHASHELRTPLTIMKGEIEVTLARERCPGEYRRTLDLVNAEVDHMEHSVNDLLGLAQAEVSRDVSMRERRLVAEAIDEVVKSVLPRVEGHAIRLTCDVPSGLEAGLNWERVQHLLRNLIDNALRYASSGGEIRLQARAHGGELALIVFNSGPHIPPNDLPYLFVPFYRGRASVNGTGAGLGLALCDWVARSHGGSITAQNRPGGVSFVVHLRMAK